ncbi:MAG: Mannosyl-glycoprotein endo-beta-N-acetylglucosaminidase [Acidimicrobiales bacterium]|nr:Mannosyl-glycoprotein endo-beta-N-acetylglucosaminidase [Acidimicrobiales bacterium]
MAAVLAGLVLTPTLAAAATATPQGAARADACPTLASATPVLRASRLTAAQLAGWFTATGRTSRATADIASLAAAYTSEGADEGVAGDLAFAQSIVETGSFGFSSYVLPAYNNFAGLGADGVHRPLSFPTAREGVRAQVQHLVAYANPAATVAGLHHPLVDPRFTYVTPKGRTPRWELMGDGQWAMDGCYADKVLAVYRDISAWANSHDAAWKPFATPEGLVTHGYRELALREATPGERSAGGASLRAGAATPDGLLAGILGGESHDHVQPIVRLYIGALGRPPERDGLEYWADRHRAGVDIMRLGREIVASAEFTQRYGRPTNTGFVDLVYRNVLGRGPDSTGRAFWVTRLDAGRETRASLLTRFTQSGEHQHSAEALVQVTVVWLGMLHRLPDPSPIWWWTAAHDRGASPAALVAKVRTSGEYARVAGSS